MSIESIGVYSPDTVYGQLTRPFLGENEKPVAINSHTNYEDDDAVTILTKDSFYNNLSKMQVSVDDIRNITGLELEDGIVTTVGPESFEFPPENMLPSFQLSNYVNGTGVVYEALQNGYTAHQAIVVGNAFNSYQNAAKHNLVDVVGNLMGTNFKVA